MCVSIIHNISNNFVSIAILYGSSTTTTDNNNFTAWKIYENMKFCEPLKLRKMVHMYNTGTGEWFVTQNFIIIMMLMGGINYGVYLSIQHSKRMVYSFWCVWNSRAMIIIWTIKHVWDVDEFYPFLPYHLITFYIKGMALTLYYGICVCAVAIWQGTD